MKKLNNEIMQKILLYLNPNKGHSTWSIAKRLKLNVDDILPYLEQLERENKIVSYWRNIPSIPDWHDNVHVCWKFQ